MWFKTYWHKISFVLDRADKGEVTPEYCMAQLLLVIFCKCVTREYKNLRDVSMGYKPISLLTIKTFEIRGVICYIHISNDDGQAT